MSEDTTALGPIETAVFLKSGLDQQEGDLDGEIVIEDGSSRWSSNKSSRSELSTCLLDAEKIHGND